MTKIFTVFVLVAFVCQSRAFAQGANQGCNDGSRIYTQYIGTTNYYGTNYPVYYSGGPSSKIYYNDDGKNVTPCNQVRGTSPPAWTTSGNCWIADRVPPTNNQQNSNGSNVSYQTRVTITSYGTCNVPLDEYIGCMLLTFGMIGAFMVRKLANGSLQV